MISQQRHFQKVNHSVMLFSCICSGNLQFPVESTDLKLSVSTCEDILAAIRDTRPLASTSTFKSQTINVSSVLSGEQKPINISSATDKLLDGGLKRGHVLELSGPPGSPKERLFLSAVISAIANGDHILFLG